MRKDNVDQGVPFGPYSSYPDSLCNEIGLVRTTKASHLLLNVGAYRLAFCSKISCPYGYHGVVLVFTSMAACGLVTAAVSICRFAYVETTLDQMSQSCSVGYGHSIFNAPVNGSVSCSCPNAAYVHGTGDAAWKSGLSMGLIATFVGWVSWLVVLIGACCRRLKIPPWVFGLLFLFLGVTCLLMLVGFASDAVCGNSPSSQLNGTQVAITSGNSGNEMIQRHCTFGPGAGLAVGAGILYFISSIVAFRLKNDDPTATEVNEED